jgi:hypothetical protein
VTAPYQSRPDRLLSHAGTPLPPADPRPLRLATDSVRDHGSADAQSIHRLPRCSPMAAGPDPAPLATSRRRHPSSILTSEAPAVDPRPPAVSSSRETRAGRESDLASSTLFVLTTARRIRATP